jgi:internalin A
MKNAEKNETKPFRSLCHRWRYILAAVLILLLLITSLVFIWFTEENKPDPSSERILRLFAAAQLKVLTRLDMDPNELTDEEFAKITTLELSILEICDIKLLEKFVNLEELKLSYISFPYEAIPTWMKILSDYGFLNLNDRFLIDLSPIAKLTHLRKLEVFQSEVKNIEPLSSLVNLQSLTLGGYRISNLEPIKNLTNLQYLMFDEANISDLEPIKQLRNLETLIILVTPVSDLEPIKSLTKLQSLRINCEKITDKQIEDLQKALPKLIITR